MPEPHQITGESAPENAGDNTPAPRGHREKPAGIHHMELLFFIAFIGLWFVLQMWVLPKFGVST
jgi:hypothetical protein